MILNTDWLLEGLEHKVNKCGIVENCKPYYFTESLFSISFEKFVFTD